VLLKCRVAEEDLEKRKKKKKRKSNLKKKKRKFFVVGVLVVEWRELEGWK
jgi:hypothetical protein